METMKAVRIHSYGGPEVLVYEDAPKPSPKDGEVLIQVHAAGVNPLDWKVREGHAKDWLRHRLPLIPGWDVSGIVTETRTGKLKTGDAVYGYIDPSRDGAYAEYTVAAPGNIALKPKTMDHIHASTVPVAALTAWQALFDIAGLSRGQKILIHAAAGGVGHFAVQMARWKGAHVIGTASKNMALLKELGVDEPIDYKAVRFEDAVSDVDVVLDTIAGETQERSWKVLKKGGIMVSTLGMPSEESAKQYDARGAAVMGRADAALLTKIAGLIDEGHIKPRVEAVFSLSEARRAHEISQSGHARGKIALKIRD